VHTNGEWVVVNTCGHSRSWWSAEPQFQQAPLFGVFGVFGVEELHKLDDDDDGCKQ
jgi:hypothetical protein